MHFSADRTAHSTGCDMLDIDVIWLGQQEPQSEDGFNELLDSATKVPQASKY